MVSASTGKYLREVAKQKKLLRSYGNGVEYITEPTKTGLVGITVWVGKSNKPWHHCNVKDREAVQILLARTSESVTERQVRRRDEARKDAVALDEMSAKLQVGTLIHSSWGYDQTNCDFYQVVGRTNSTVKLRKIRGTEDEKASKGCAPMACYMRAVKDAFVGDKVITKRIMPHGVSFSFGIGTPTTEDETHYCSWYA